MITQPHCKYKKAISGRFHHHLDVTLSVMAVSLQAKSQLLKTIGARCIRLQVELDCINRGAVDAVLMEYHFAMAPADDRR
jgi:hypothetical protein